MNKEFKRIEAAIQTAKESRDAAVDFLSDLKGLYRLIEGNKDWYEDVTVLDVLNHPVFGKPYQKFLKKDFNGLYYVSCDCEPFKHVIA